LKTKIRAQHPDSIFICHRKLMLDENETVNNSPHHKGFWSIVVALGVAQVAWIVWLALIAFGVAG